MANENKVEYKITSSETSVLIKYNLYADPQKNRKTVNFKIVLFHTM